METETIDSKETINRLKKIEVAIEYIKEQMPNKDMFLTPEEKMLLKESYENEKQGLLVSNKNARKQLGL